MNQRGWCLRFSIALLTFVLASHLSAQTPGTDVELPLRIGLVRQLKGVKQLTVSASSKYKIVLTSTKESVTSSDDLGPTVIKACDARIIIQPSKGQSSTVSGSITILPDDPGVLLSVNSPGRVGKQYRGYIEITSINGILQVINIIAMEDYLRGVLAGEMPSSYPEEALKAQAIAARSYTVRARGRHADAGFDLCDDNHCQVYDGTLRERASCAAAVTATAGRILTHGGRVASIMYCADCGGITAGYSEAHKDTVPYLISVTEPVEIAHRSWEKSFKLADISAKLIAAGVKEAVGLKSICISKVGLSGRAVSLSICGEKGTAEITGTKLRTALGGTSLPSTLFTLTTSNNGSVTFKGKGFGHGVGMCQIGAGALARPPFNYTCEQILAHYYPTTTITNELEKSDSTATSLQAESNP